MWRCWSCARSRAWPCPWASRGGLGGFARPILVVARVMVHTHRSVRCFWLRNMCATWSGPCMWRRWSCARSRAWPCPWASCGRLGGFARPILVVARVMVHTHRSVRCFWSRKMCATWERTLHVATLVLRTASGMALPLGFPRWTWRIRKADLVGGTGDGAHA